MGVVRIIGFALVVVLVLAGLDYYQQDKKSTGTLSASGYVDTIKERLAQYDKELDAEQLERERQQRWRAGSEPFAPKSGEDWVRRAIVDRDYTRDAREGVLQDGISEAPARWPSRSRSRKCRCWPKSWIVPVGSMKTARTQSGFRFL